MVLRTWFSPKSRASNILRTLPEWNRGKKTSSPEKTRENAPLPRGEGSVKERAHDRAIARDIRPTKLRGRAGPLLRAPARPIASRRSYTTGRRARMRARIRRSCRQGHLRMQGAADHSWVFLACVGCRISGEPSKTENKQAPPVAGPLTMDHWDQSLKARSRIRLTTTPRSRYFAPPMTERDCRMRK